MPCPESKTEIINDSLNKKKNLHDNLSLIKENNDLKKKLHMFESNYTKLMDQFNTLLNSNIISRTDSKMSNDQISSQNQLTHSVISLNQGIKIMNDKFNEEMKSEKKNFRNLFTEIDSDLPCDN